MATYSDAFTGTSGNAISTSLWTVTTGLTGPVIRSNAARGNATGSAVSSAYSKTAVGADQSMTANATAAPSSSVSFITVRQAAAADTCYALGFESFDNGVDPAAIQLTLYRIVAGAKTLLVLYQPDPATSPGAPTSTVQLIAEGTGSTVALTVKVAGATVATYTDTNAARLTSGQPGIRFQGNSTTYLIDNASWGDYTAAAVPCTVALPVASSGSSAGTMAAGATVFAALPPASSVSTAAELARPSDVALPAAASSSAAGTFTVSSVVPPLYSDAFGGSDGVPLSSPWTKIGDSTSMPVNRSGGVAMADSNTAGAFYNQPITDGQYAEATLRRTQDNAEVAVVGVQSRTTRRGFTFTVRNVPDESFCQVNLSLSADVSLGAAQAYAYVPVLAGSERIRIECAGTVVRGYIDGTKVVEATGVAPLTGGFPAIFPFSTLVSLDDFAAGPTPVPCTVALPTASSVSAGQLGRPIDCTVALPTAASVSSGQLGRPFACTVALPSAASQSAAGTLTAKASRVKASEIFPAFSAFGGLDSYSGKQKGQIAGDGDLSIGYRVGIGNDGTAGDRVFFAVPLASMLRADVPTDPVAKATLHVTFLSMMSWDYLATGAAANPSGVAFKVRKVTGGSGMTATLAGDYGTITAKPVWLSGQTWYDGATRGNPVWQCEVDVTSLYNEAAQAGTSLAFCLDCQFTNTKWLAEIAGKDPNLAWARPRIEVHRWGEVGVSITATETCTPTVAVSAPAGGTISEIRWGYDEQCTPQGGSFKYVDGNEGRAVGFDQGNPGSSGTDESGKGLTVRNPYTFPMLESSTRVHVEVEIDFGAKGDLVFRRTFKTPQAPAPRLELKSGVYSLTDSPDPDHASYGWTDVRGPTHWFGASHGERWAVFAKRSHADTWQPNTAVRRGDSVLKNGYCWYVRTAGTTGASDPLPSTPDLTSGKAVIITESTGVEWLTLFTIEALPTPINYLTLAYQDAEGSGDFWEAFVCLAYQNDYRFRLANGACPSYDPLYAGTPWPLAAPSDQRVAWGSGGFGGTPDAAGSFALRLHADDVSELFFDHVSGRLFFLSSHVVAGSYEIRWNVIGADGENMGLAGIEMYPAPFPPRYSQTIYTATARPDLKLSAIARGADWRYSIHMDPWPPVFAAFVADGSLRVYRADLPTFTAGNMPTKESAGSNLIRPCGDLQSGWRWDPSVVFAEDLSPVTVSGITEVRFHHVLTRAHAHSIVLSAIGTGTGYLLSRSDDVIATPNGGGMTRTRGTWTSGSSGAFARVWATESLPYDANGHMPDSATAAIAVQMRDGAVQFRYPGGSTIPGGDPVLAPDADFDTSATYHWTKRVVGRWPTLPGAGEIGTYATTSNGGIVSFRASGSTLYAQRVSDFLRVSDEASTDVGETITEIHVAHDSFWEGEPVPVVLKTTSGYRVVKVTVGTDLSRLYLPFHDMRSRFSSGKLETASVYQGSLNMRAPGDFTKLPGHNAFAIGWTFDPFTNPLGMMNEAGWNYFAFTGCAGERVRVLVHDTPAFGGKWRNGALLPPTYDAGYQPEALGGCEWMAQKMSTWWWTNDPPESRDREWRRVLDGTDYVLDGESNGGLYVVTIQSPGDTLYLAHDPVHDPASWRGEAAAWLSGPSAAKIKWMNAKGELLYGIGASATTPISEVDFE